MRREAQGLEGVVAASTRLSCVDGVADQLIMRDLFPAPISALGREFSPAPLSLDECKTRQNSPKRRK
jgi:hypothetical protein